MDSSFDDFSIEGIDFLDLDNVQNVLTAEDPNLNNFVLDSSSGDLVELDANELEVLLGDNNQDSLYHDTWMDAPFNNNSTIIDNYQEILINPASGLSETSYFKEIKQQPEPNNVLIITIPEPLQRSSVFNKFPTVPLDLNSIEKINKVATGFDGAFLRMGKQTLKKSLSPVRRPPLQVIQPLVNNNKPRSIKPKTNGTQCKRKQRFEFTREDGVSFTDDTNAPKRFRALNDQEFVWATTSDEETDKAPEAIEESNRCQMCKKKYKKKHKCKKEQPLAEEIYKCSICKKTFTNLSEQAEHERTHIFVICVGCDEKFKSKRALSKHVKHCVPTFLLEPTKKSVKVLKEDKSITKRQTRSSIQKRSSSSV